MGVKSLLMPYAAAWLTSTETLHRARRKTEKARQAAGASHDVHLFLQTDDPYSYLLCQRLEALSQRYDIRLIPHITPQPDDWAAPERQKLQAWSIRDARRIAERQGCSFTPASDHNPDQHLVALTESLLVTLATDNTLLPDAVSVLDAFWQQDRAGLQALSEKITPAPRETCLHHLADSHQQRERLGHYLGGMLYYGGEWYWGLDRLHYLEDRLYQLGARKDGGAKPLVAPVDLQCLPGLRANDTTPALEFFASVRSPYTAVACKRVKQLEQHYGLKVTLRPVLPMAMRGMTVPKSKRTYMPLDAKRESVRLGEEFGRICDPLGKPVERALALMPVAMAADRALDFMLSLADGIWREGRDAGSNRQLRLMAERAGLDWAACKTALQDDGWQQMAQDNRQDMFAMGLWGVPSFRFKDTIAWGQDRLWVMEEAIIKHLQSGEDA